MNPFRWPLYAQTLVGIVLGIAIGITFGKEAAPLGILAKGIVQIIKGLATPLLFCAILDALLGAQIRGRGVTALFGVCAFNGACAMAIAFLIANIFHTGRYFTVAAGTKDLGAVGKVDWAQGIAGFFPESVVGPFVTNTIPAVILIAIGLGLALRAVEKAEPDLRPIGDQIRLAIRLGFRVLVQVIEWVICLVPFAVLGAVAKSVGENGVGFLAGLGAYLVTCIAGMAIHILVVYQGWIVVAGKRTLRQFWSTVREPMVYAFGVNSSLATLPITLKALDRLGVSPASARLSACVGTNLNNDGILLYEVAAALFLAQAHGLDLSIVQQATIAVIAIFATIGIPGIPEAGLISLSLVLTTVGLPVESLPLLLTVDWVLGRMRSVTNVLGDITVGVAIDHVSRPETLPRAA